VIVAGQSDWDGLVLANDTLYAVHNTTLSRIPAGATHTPQAVATATTELDLVDRGALGSALFAIKDTGALVAYVGANSLMAAWTDDPAWVWQRATFVTPPHRLAGTIVIVESNRTLNVDRLLVVTPQM
jgi:hypothetical protein